jgi:hypothetical protein
MSGNPDKQESKRDDKGRFLPGHSGNPNGRPKRKTLTELLCIELDHQCPGDKLGRTWAEVIVAATLTQGVRGKTEALKEVWNRSDGRVATEVELSGGVDLNGNARESLAAKISALAGRSGQEEDSGESD